MTSAKVKNIYFIGIGGIGMSALARFYRHIGMSVAGYDKTPSPLTKQLECEGIAIHYEDSVEKIDSKFLDKSQTLVIYTPAIPKDHQEFNYFVDNGFEVIKRSKALGALSSDKRLIAVAGTHGKTSISTMITYFSSLALRVDGGEYGGASALIGGIMKNFDSNLFLGRGDTLIVEADEFDRSFLQLYPDIAIVSSMDADHLDIYGNHDALKESFNNFVSQINDGGSLIFHKGTTLDKKSDKVRGYQYSLDCENSDFYAENIELCEDGLYRYDVVTPMGRISGFKLGIPGIINVENSIAAIAALTLAGCSVEALKEAVSTFRGVKRRFEVYVNTPQKVYIDDYAHHPQELLSTIESIKSIFKGKTITAIFQPHLFTRTRDFAEGFSASLSMVDRVLLLPIYPARELPIEGVCSEMLLDNITIEDKRVVEKQELLDVLKEDKNDIVVSFGAGDIDRFCGAISELYAPETEKKSCYE